jgi:hypothetical protein
VQNARGVRVAEGLEQSAGDGQRLRERKGPAPQPVTQRLARHEFHREKRHAVGLSRLEERRDRRVLEPRARLRFTEQACPRVGRQRRRKHLDGGHPAQGEIAREEDLAHTARPEAPFDAVVRDRAVEHASLPAADYLLAAT